jgi:septal ring factor EnvC (AmiA/AmiB activator)
LLAEQAKTEQAQKGTLLLLWEITGKRIVVGSRDMTDWARTDREYAWSRELYAALERYRVLLDRQEAKLVEVLGRRDKFSRDMQKRLTAVGNEKSQLLKSRLAYDRQLAELRKKRGSAETELNGILRLVDSLNLEISQRADDDIASMKGRLPRPVSGNVRLRYAPQAVPASRGLGFAAPEKADVRAVAGGKVVHNDVLRGFGTVLIVQHGEDYYTLYAFLGSSPLRVGQEVAGRQKIGTVGLYPALQGPGLYFELRFKQKAINPEQWFAS